MDRPIDVSVVLPAYNEATTIEETVDTTIDHLAAFLPLGSYEVLIAEDGCTDRTPAIADDLAAADSRVRHVHADERLGRGRALERAFETARGDTLVYFDTDLATDMCHLEELIESVRRGDADVATGSRWMPDNVADRPPKRRVASRGFNGLTRLFLGSEVRDHQCGFKAFDRSALFDVLDDVEDDHWFWDTEVLVRAQRAGYTVYEFPVEWSPKGDSKVDLVRDVFGMGTGILRSWWDLSIEPRITPRTSAFVGTGLIVVAVALMSVYLDFGVVLTEIRTADPLMVLVAAGVYLGSWPIRGLRYQRILDEMGYPASVGFLTGSVFLSQTGNLVIPARAGDAIRAYVVKTRRGIPYTAGFGSLAVERVFDLLTITGLAVVTLFGFALTGLDLVALSSTLLGGRASGRIGILSATGVGLLTVTVFFLIAGTARGSGGYIKTAIGRLSGDHYANRLVETIQRFVGDVQRSTTDPLTFLAIKTTSVVIWSLDIVTALLIFLAMGVGISPVAGATVLLFAVSVGNLAKVLPLSPGGIGLYEGAFSVIVVAMLPVVGWEAAIAVAVVDHAVKNTVTIVGGAVTTTRINISLTAAIEEGSDGEPTASEYPQTD